MTQRVSIVSFILCISVLSSGCTKEGPTVDYGHKTATGTLVRAELSLTRRGTHELIIGGKFMYYVESRTENLADYEGQTVAIEGMLEANTTNTDLPVLVAEKIKGLDQNADLRRFEIPDLNLRVGIPVGWNGAIREHVASFLLEGETEPLLSIRRMSGSTLPPGGTLLFIKNRRTTRISLGGGASDVYILDKDTVIHLYFDPAKQESIRTKEDSEIVNAQFERVLSSITFMNEKSLTTQNSGTGAGLPCGGVAGQRCPSGTFCDVKDIVTKTGVCKAR